MEKSKSGFENIPENIEIERNFLIEISSKDLEEVLERAVTREEILQIYLPVEQDGIIRRIRRITKENGKEEFWETIKSGYGLVREEKESRIDEREFDQLHDEHKGKWRAITKTRYKIPTDPTVEDSPVIELDIYQDEYLAGLITAEVEFNSETEAESFELPEWLREFATDVTEDQRYLNSELAKHGPPED